MMRVRIAATVAAGALAWQPAYAHQVAQPDYAAEAERIIEGLGAKRAAGWASRFQEVLGLADNQVHFMRYHEQADAQHTGDMEAILNSGLVDDTTADEIVRCAQVVARLYALQLEELDR